MFNRNKDNKETLFLPSWAANRPNWPAAAFRPGAAQPARHRAARQLGLASESLTRGPLSSDAMSPPSFPFLFPFFFLSSHPRPPPWKGVAVRPCPPPRMASTHRVVDRAVHPTYLRLYKHRHGPRAQTLANWGFPFPNPPLLT
jgi:hypothetical protein